ncbi:MAG TPA: hypothetical protein VIY29_03100 [Ktedonobacteraceae bacterium]
MKIFVAILQEEGYEEFESHPSNAASAPELRQIANDASASSCRSGNLQGVRFAQDGCKEVSILYHAQYMLCAAPGDFLRPESSVSVCDSGSYFSGFITNAFDRGNRAVRPNLDGIPGAGVY